MHTPQSTWMVALLVCMHQVLAHSQQQQQQQQPLHVPYEKQQGPLEEVPFLPPSIPPKVTTPAHNEPDSQWPLHGSGTLFSPSSTVPKEPRFLGAADPPTNSTLRLWYRRPADASSLEQQGFLIGNGRTQTISGGAVNYERLILSEESCWTGGPHEYSSYWGGNVPRDQAGPKQEALARVQQALAEKRILKPSVPFLKDVMGDEGGFGRHVGAVGEVTVEEVDLRESVWGYRREVDLERGVARVQYSIGKTLYSREQFCSYPDAVCILRIQSSTPKTINIRVSLSTPHSSTTAEYTNIHNRLGFKSHLDSNSLTIEAQVAVKAEGATGISLATSPQQIVLMGFDAVTLYYTFGTGWAASAFPEFTNLDPHERLMGVLDKVIIGWYGDLVAKHLSDYGGLFSRFRVEFGEAGQDQGTIGNTLTTDQLVARSARGTLPAEEETYLETLLVQYSRYLLIASSRPGSLPVTGNGIWASKDNIHATLSSKFGMNIDLQMQYWMAETTDLGETVTPLIDYMEQLLQPRGQDTASLLYNARGWTTHPFSNIWAHTGPLSDTSAKDTFYFPAAAAWLCQHLWDRYLYSQDEKFLKDRAYKLMKGASLFWMDTLVKDRGNGSLLSSPSQSPGHGPFTEGSALDQQLVFQLWNRTLEAATSVVNEKDKAFVQELTGKLANLSRGLKVGSWGQLQEWNLDLDEPGERVAHLGPLYAVYPGDQIYLQEQQQGSMMQADGEEEPTMQELVEAARVSLRSRGSGSLSEGGNGYEQGWSRTWRAVTWARLNDGHQAYQALSTFKHQNLVSPNLLPLSLSDLSGHVGFGAAVIEMIVQSPHPGDVNALPCFEGLPERWAKQGRVFGYRTRDGHVVGVEWKDRRVRSVEVYAALRKGPINLRVATLISEGKGVETITVMMKGSKKPVPFVKDGDVLKFTVNKGSTYLVSVDLVEQ
ncbi:Six-hairpin glycosidase-like protein [Linnemannia elongata]|nr:Six-hairpin glycosidase-like protein [Linnemannia elongata]